MRDWTWMLAGVSWRSPPNVGSKFYTLGDLRGRASVCGALARLATNHVDQRLRGSLQGAVSTIDEIEAALDAHLAQPHFLQRSAADFAVHAHARDNRHALLHLHEELDAFDRGYFDIGPQGNAMAREHLHNALPVRRRNDVRHERLIFQILDVHFAALGQPVARPHDERKRVAAELHTGQFAFLGQIRDHPDIEVVIQHFAGHVA